MNQTKVKRESLAFKVGHYLFIIVMIFIFLLPLYWMLTTSIKTRTDIIHWPPIYIPKVIDFEGYVRVWEHQNIPAFYLNTIIVNISAALLAVAFGIPGAYAASRYKFWQKDNIMFTILSVRFLPPATALLPIFILFKWLHLIDHPLVLIIIYAGVNLPLVVWVLKSFFDEIPLAMEESYLLDGHSRLKSFFKIIIPLGAPGIAAMFMICIFLTWGEFLFAIVLTFSQKAQTLPVGTANLEGDIGVLWNQIAACGVMAAIPIILIIVFFQKYLVRGFSFGILK